MRSIRKSPKTATARAIKRVAVASFFENLTPEDIVVMNHEARRGFCSRNHISRREMSLAYPEIEEFFLERVKAS